MPDTPFPPDAEALAEVARDLAALEGEPLEGLRPDVRAAALAAWSVAATGEALRGGPRPALQGAAPRRLRPRGRSAPHLLRWAALLVVGLGVTLFAALSAPESATAGLRLGTVQRLDQAAGSHVTTSSQRIPWGERLAVGVHEVLGFRLPDGSAVVLRDAGAIRPTCDGDGQAVLVLESGTARAAVAGGGEVRFAVGSCRLDLLEGRACVSADGHVLALGPSGRCRVRGRGALPRLLEGPLEARCRAPGEVVLLPDAPAPARFAMPAAFAVDHIGRAPGRPVPARLWRVVSGEGRRRGTSVRIGGAGARLAWRPSPDLVRARVLRLRLVDAEGVEVSIEGPAGDTLPSASATEIVLPAGWLERLVANGEELVVTLRPAARSGGGARFLGAVFLSAHESTKE